MFPYEIKKYEYVTHGQKRIWSELGRIYCSECLQNIVETREKNPYELSGISFQLFPTLIQSNLIVSEVTSIVYMSTCDNLLPKPWELFTSTHELNLVQHITVAY